MDLLINTRATALALAAAAASGCFPDYDPPRDAGAEAPAAPVIQSIEGNSPLGAPEGTSLLHDGLRAHGLYLDDTVRVRLDSAGGPDFELPILTAGEELLEVGLPSELVAGSYDFIVETPAGEASVPVVLLRGDPGAAGTAALEQLYTWDELTLLLPDAEALVDQSAATARYAGRGLAIDLEAYAKPEALSELASIEHAFETYEPAASLPDPSGYPTEAAMLDTYAQPTDLPDVTGVLTKAQLAVQLGDVGAYATKAWAAAEGVPKGGADEAIYSAAEVVAKFLPKAATALSPVHEAQVAELVKAALDKAECPAGTVPVGPGANVCIDRLEARVMGGSCTAGTKVFGVDKDDFPPAFGDDASVSGLPFLACQVGAQPPTAHVTWFQAQAACVAVGARLCTGAEWQAAAAGTPDDIETSGCVLQSAAAQAAGAPGQCASNAGAMDMAGNLAEWTAEWRAAGHVAPPAISVPPVVQWPIGSVQEAVVGWKGAGVVKPGQWHYGVPVAVVRGGGFSSGAQGGVFNINMTLLPFSASAEVGFRCCRER